MNVNTGKPKVQGVGLVRDKDGNPKIDGDPKRMRPELAAMLTDDERKRLGVDSHVDHRDPGAA